MTTMVAGSGDEKRRRKKTNQKKHSGPPIQTSCPYCLPFENHLGMEEGYMCDRSSVRLDGKDFHCHGCVHYPPVVKSKE